VVIIKQLLISLTLAVAVTAQAADSHSADVAKADAAKAQAQHETKKICVDVMKDGKEVKDPKTGKTKQTCKEVKQHQKLEGTKVPEKK
jgi:hypothetical protein